MAPDALKTGSKVWDWWGKSIGDAWYARLHDEREARFIVELSLFWAIFTKKAANIP